MTFRFKQATSSGREDSIKEVYTILEENTEVLEIDRIDPQTQKEFKNPECKVDQGQVTEGGPDGFRLPVMLP